MSERPIEEHLSIAKLFVHDDEDPPFRIVKTLELGRGSWLCDIVNITTGQIIDHQVKVKGADFAEARRIGIEVKEVRK